MKISLVFNHFCPFLMWWFGMSTMGQCRHNGFAAWLAFEYAEDVLSQEVDCAAPSFTVVAIQLSMTWYVPPYKNCNPLWKNVVEEEERYNLETFFSSSTSSIFFFYHQKPVETGLSIPVNWMVIQSSGRAASRRLEGNIRILYNAIN